MQRATGEGRTLAATMPRLILEARRVAATVIHGLHGRRRAGSGENFWQFRRFVSGEPASRVDWRRSARDDHLYVREQEWEAAHTVWIWPDRSPSMVFASPLVRETKLDRALVVAFALAEVLVEGGERVGIPGPDAPDREPQHHREDGRRRSCTIATERASLPPTFAPSPLSEIVVLSDLWSPIADVQRTIAQLSGERRARPRGADRRSGGGDLPVFRPRRIRRAGRRRHASPPAAPRPGAPTIRRRSSAIAREIRAETDRLGWSFTIHRTDRPASELLLALHARMGAGLERQRHHALHGERRSEERRMIAGLPLGFAAAAGAARAARACRCCGGCCGWCRRARAASMFPPTRLLLEIAAEGRDAGAHAVVADAAAAYARGAADLRRRRSAVESAARDLAGVSAPLALLIDDGWAAAATWDARAAHRRRPDRARRNRQSRRRAHPAVRGRRATFRSKRRGAARVRLRSAQAEAAYGRPHRGAAGDHALPRRRRRDVEVVWLSDGVDLGEGQRISSTSLASCCRASVRSPWSTAASPAAHALTAADNAAGALTVKVLRAAPRDNEIGTRARARSEGPAARRGAVRLQGQRPRDRGARSTCRSKSATTSRALEIAGERSAGAVQLLDKRWRRRTVGVVSGATADTAQPLLASTYYLARALGPFADVRLAERGSPAEAVSAVPRRRTCRC